MSIDLPLEPTNKISVSAPRWSSRISHLLNWYGFHTLLASIRSSSSYLKASKHGCWKETMVEVLQALEDSLA